ncbi:MAG TPA: prolipoprotein diacylglyceryl transferase [Deinococcales bacterium]|nr:prolipoprotein diacylglyceryl transferase [Deinococcales bacterium]
MFPDLIHAFGFVVTWHGVLIVLGIYAGMAVATRLARARGLDVNRLSDLVFGAVLWGVVGARVVYVLTSFDEFRGRGLLAMIDLRGGGLSFHGSILFGIGYLVYAQWRYRLSFYRYADLLVPGVALGIIGGRIGNFFNGSDTVGRLTGWPIGFTWPEAGEPFLGFVNPRNWASFSDLCYRPGGTTITSMSGLAECTGGVLLRGPVHLTQLYGAVTGLVIVIASIWWLRSRRPGWAFWNLVLWYSILRSTIEEPFRLNPLWWKVYLNEGPNAPGIGLFTATQLFSIPLIVAAVVMLVLIRRRAPDPVPDATSAGPQVGDRLGSALLPKLQAGPLGRTGGKP